MAPVHGPSFRLIAGLGNPGREYEGTRHNVGFMILDRLAARAGTPFRVEPRWRAAIATLPGGVILCKPLSYMNLSGEPVSAVARFHKIDPAQTLAIFDDVALPLGKLRLRPAGSAGGHNGMKSLLQHLGDIPRLRVGIGAAAGDHMVSHVLGKFTPPEQAAVEEAIGNAIAALDCLQTHGLEAAMNQFN